MKSVRRVRASRGGGDGGVETASFEAFWDGEAREQFGDLGPAEEPAGAGRCAQRRRSRGGARRGGRRWPPGWRRLAA